MNRSGRAVSISPPNDPNMIRDGISDTRADRAASKNQSLPPTQNAPEPPIGGECEIAGGRVLADSRENGENPESLVSLANRIC